MMETHSDFAWIDEMTRRFHQRTGFYPDKEEVIRQIRLYRKECLISGRKGWGKTAIRNRSLARFSMTESIRKISESEEEDPVWTLIKFMSDLDDMLTSSEHSATWIFTQLLYNGVRDFLEFLG